MSFEQQFYITYVVKKPDIWTCKPKIHMPTLSTLVYKCRMFTCEPVPLVSLFHLLWKYEINSIPPSKLWVFIITCVYVHSLGFRFHLWGVEGNRVKNGFLASKILPYHTFFFYHMCALLSTHVLKMHTLYPITVIHLQNQSKPGRKHRHSGSGSQFDTHLTGIGLMDPLILDPSIY